MCKEPFSPPVVLTIAGSDSSAGAGVQADLKAIHANNGYALTVVTGVVAESPHKVVSWQALPQQLIMDQIKSVFDAYPIAAVKIGLLFDESIVESLASYFAGEDIPIVIDPVGTASAGGSFGGTRVRDAIASELFPIVTVVTPNMTEARVFAKGGDSLDQRQLASALRDEYKSAILVKGGHSTDLEYAVDVLALKTGELQAFTARRLEGVDYHGTGCSLSAAIATHLAFQKSLPQATEAAKKYLYEAMRSGFMWSYPSSPFKTYALNTLRLNS